MITNSIVKAAHNKGEKLAFVFFWDEDPTSEEMGPYCMSQWYPAQFAVEGITYATAEQYMMAQKALLFGDKEICAKIMASEDPAEYKALGRQVRNFDSALWEANKIRIVLEGNTAKFSQNPELKAYLLSTGDKVIVEASPEDWIWGVGMDEANPAIYDPNKWEGENLLGYVMMEVRETIR